MAVAKEPEIIGELPDPITSEFVDDLFESIPYKIRDSLDHEGSSIGQRSKVLSVSGEVLRLTDYVVEGDAGTGRIVQLDKQTQGSRSSATFSHWLSVVLQSPHTLVTGDTREK